MELFNKHTGAQGHARGGEDLPRRAVCCVGAEAHLPPRAGKAGRGSYRGHHLHEEAHKCLDGSARRPVWRRGVIQAEVSCVAWRQWHVWREVRPPDWMAAGSCEG